MNFLPSFLGIHRALPCYDCLSPREVMFVEQRAGGSQGSSVWLVQLVLQRVCSNEQTLFHPSSLVGCQGCCKTLTEGSMRLFMWHKDQKAVSHRLTANSANGPDMNTYPSS